MFRSLLIFGLAGLAEIGGGWLVWKWWPDGRSLKWGIAGVLCLASYGIIATYQPAQFGRTYAAYGGVFIAMSLLWAWAFEGERPDIPDLVGIAFALIGVGVMMYWPRVR